MVHRLTCGMHVKQIKDNGNLLLSVLQSYTDNVSDEIVDPTTHRVSFTRYLKTTYLLKVYGNDSLILTSTS